MIKLACTNSQQTGLYKEAPLQGVMPICMSSNALLPGLYENPAGTRTLCSTVLAVCFNTPSICCHMLHDMFCAVLPSLQMFCICWYHHIEHITQSS